MNVANILHGIGELEDAIRCHKEAIKQASAKIAYAEAQVVKAIGVDAFTFSGRIYFARDGKLCSSLLRYAADFKTDALSVEDSFPVLATVPADAVQDVDEKELLTWGDPEAPITQPY